MRFSTFIQEKRKNLISPGFSALWGPTLTSNGHVLEFTMISKVVHWSLLYKFTLIRKIRVGWFLTNWSRPPLGEFLNFFWHDLYWCQSWVKSRQLYATGYNGLDTLCRIGYAECSPRRVGGILDSFLKKVSPERPPPMPHSLCGIGYAA